MIRSSRDYISNPTFDKLLERAKNYTHLVPLNEAEDNGASGTTSQPAQGNKPATPLKTPQQQPTPANNGAVNNTSTSTSGQASVEKKDDKQPEQKPEQNNQAKPAAVAPKDIIYVCKVIASNLLTLLSAYHVNSPAVSSNQIPGLSDLSGTKTMDAFIKGIITGLDSITSVINGDEDAKFYGDFISAKDQALKMYQDALSKFPDALTMEIPDLGAYIKPQVDVLQSNINNMAAATPKKVQKPAETPNKGFGDFTNFHAYEAMLLEQEDLGEDDNQSLDKLKSDLQRAEDKQKEGKERATDRIKRRIFVELIDGCEDVMGRVDAVRNKIAIGAANPNQANFGSFKMEDQFVALASDIKTMRDQLKTQDPESIESVNRLITRYETKLKDYVSLEKKFRDQYNHELDDLESKNSIKGKSPEAFDLILQGNNARQKVENYSIQNRKAIQNTTTDAGSDVKNNLKLDSPIKAGLKKGVKDENVSKFQSLVINKFGNLDGFKNEQTFQKFVKFQGDGKFGPTTERIVKALKAGFKMTDNTSDITQELIDKVNSFDGKIQEKRTFSFEMFNRVSEQFDMKAAKTVLGTREQEGGGNPKKNRATKIDVDQANNISKQANLKKVPQEDVAKIKNDAIKGYKIQQLIDELTKMGAQKNENYGKDGATCIASGTGARFFENGAVMRTFDKEMGTFDLKAGVCKWEDGTQDKIVDLIKNDNLPSKYAAYLSKLVEDIYGDGSRNKQLYRELMNWTPEQVKLLSMAYSVAHSPYWDKGKKHNLDKDLSDEMTNTDEIREFQKKFASVL